MRAGDKMEQCKYVLAWIGECGKEANHEGFCEEHSKQVCRGCGEKATKECPATLQLVCGAPICDKCEHDYSSHSHARKTE